MIGSNRPRLAAVAACLLLEILVRVATYRAVDVVSSAPEVLYLDGKPALTPGAYGDQVPSRMLWMMDPSRPYAVRITKDGFRGNHDVAPGDRKVLVLGNSYAFGAFLTQNDTWPILLEARLRNIPEYADVRVFNAALPGYGMQEQLALVADKALAFKPHLVILQFDPWLIDAVATAHVPRPAGGETALHATGRRSAVVRLVNGTARDLLLLRDGLLQAPIRPAESAGATPDDYAMFATYVVKLHEMLRDANVPLAVVAFPALGQVAGACDDRTQRYMTQLGAGLGVPVLDLLSQFRSHTAEEMYLVTYVASGPPATGCFPDARRYSGPAYPSRFGNQVSSDAIVAWLRTTGILDSGHRR